MNTSLGLGRRKSDEENRIVMAIFITDPSIEQRLCSERETSGADRYDEVWEGIHMRAPLPNDEHRVLVSRLGYILEDCVGMPGLGQVRPGVNLSDRDEDWKDDYRVPDLAVFLEGGKATNLGTHWRGAADFLIEIISPNDNTRDKVPYYARLGAQELLLIDRDPWSLELLRQQDGALSLISTSDLNTCEPLTCETVQLTFRLVAATSRPQIGVNYLHSDRMWLV